MQLVCVCVFSLLDERLLLELQEDGAHTADVFQVLVRFRVEVAQLGDTIPLLARRRVSWSNQLSF